jgi:ABC-type transport system substrate-binding protein
MSAVLFEWINPSEPDDSYFWQSSQIVTAQHPGGGNYVGYANPLVDSLTADAAHALDDPTRVRLYFRIQRILVADQPVIFLAWHQVLTITSGHTHGVTPNPYDSALTWNAKDWYLVTS